MEVPAEAQEVDEIIDHLITPGTHVFYQLILVCIHEEVKFVLVRQCKGLLQLGQRKLVQISPLTTDFFVVTLTNL